MKLSYYGQQMAKPSAIAELMSDLGRALNTNPDLLFLGGGNPATVPAVTDIFKRHLTAMVDEDAASWLGIYQSPQGSELLLESAGRYLNAKGWPVTQRNLLVVNGGQTAASFIFKLFAGPSENGIRHVQFPLVPEYVGYSGQMLGGDYFLSTRPVIRQTEAHRFVYELDKNNFSISKSTALLALSRPTNPSARVLPKDDLAWLSEQVEREGVPLVVDCAYGAPFPAIMSPEEAYRWQPGQIALLSASKVGLPGLRTAIVVADPDVVTIMQRTAAIENLAAGNTGALLLSRLMRTGDLDRCCALLQAFYRSQRETMIRLLDEALEGTDYAIHEPEGAFFVWVHFKALSVSSQVLYETLKAKGVLIMAGEAFFFDQRDWRHSQECIRLNICQPKEAMERAVSIIAETVKAFR